MWLSQPQNDTKQTMNRRGLVREIQVWAEACLRRLRKGALLLLLLFVCQGVEAQSYELRPLKGRNLEGRLVPTERRGNWGYADEKGKVVVKAIFAEAEEFVDTLARVKWGNKWGVLRRNAEYLFEPVYDTITPFVGATAWVSNGGKWGVVTKGGKTLFEPQFTARNPFVDGMAWVEREGRWGLIADDGRVLFGYELYKCPTFEESVCWAHWVVAGVRCRPVVR